MLASNWFIRQPRTSYAMRMYCLPCAGGNAATYRDWQSMLGTTAQVCAVQLPGRGTRLHEAAPTDMSSVVRDLAMQITAEADRPFVLFGHSLGALLAFEVARYCRLAYLPSPACLIAAGCDPPPLRRTSRGLHSLSDADLARELASYNGTPPGVLESRELMAVMLPAIRSDFELAETYAYRAAPPLNVPITVLAGRNDPHIDRDNVHAWSRETSAACEVHWFDGDHFFVQSARDDVLDLVRATLAELPCTS